MKEAATHAKPKIMVIDDQPVIADTLAEILSQNGYDAVALYSAEEALKSVKRSQPAIVLSDIRMHRVNGIEAAVHIRNLHPACRIILFSASGVSEWEQATMNERGFEFLPRPLHPAEVLKQLRGRKNENVIPFRRPRGI